MEQAWKCLICGYIHFGEEPPKECPVCGAPQDDFELVTNIENSRIESDSSQSGYTQSTDEKPQRVVVVGSGIAALSAIEAIREDDDEITITLISAEEALPYYRLNLTRYLAEEVTLQELTIHSRTWYDEQRIELHLGSTVTEIDRSRKEVIVEDNDAFSYDKLVLALGAHPFIPPFKGSHLNGVVTFRTVGDVHWILNSKSTIRKCIAIGGGVLGLEAAAGLAKQGIEVTVLEGAKWLMPRQLNPEAADLLVDYLKTLGIRTLTGVDISHIEHDGSGHCKAVVLSDGQVFEADMVSLATGVRPNIYLAKESGLETDVGVIANNYMQSSDPDIYVPGDISEHFGIAYGLWSIAMYQGTIAGKNILGKKMQFGSVPRSNVVKVLGIDLFSIGKFMSEDGSYKEISKKDGQSYFHFVLHDNKIVGSIIMGNKELAVKVKKAVEKEIPVPMHLIKTVEDLLEKL